MLGALIFATAKHFGIGGRNGGGTQFYNFDPKKHLKISFRSEDTVVIEYSGKSDGWLENSEFEFKDNIKTVVHSEAISNPRGFYYWLKLYEARLPSGTSGFWQHPLTITCKKSPNVWFHKNKKIGKNFFNILIKEMFEMAGISQTYSLRCVGIMIRREQETRQINPSQGSTDTCLPEEEGAPQLPAEEGYQSSLTDRSLKCPQQYPLQPLQLSSKRTTQQQLQQQSQQQLQPTLQLQLQEQVHEIRTSPLLKVMDHDEGRSPP